MAGLSRGATDLRAFLKAHNITQLAAAGALGVSAVTLHDWLTGAKRPRAERREAIARWTRGAVPESAWATSDERAAASKVVPFRPPRRRRTARNGTEG